MAAPILWAPRISVFFLQENRHVHKIPRFRGGGYFGFGEGGKRADFTFIGAGIFLKTYGLPKLFFATRGFHENDGNHKNDEDNPDNHKQGPKGLSAG